MSTTAIACNPLLSREEAAAYLGVKPQTLAVWACRRTAGPPFFKIGARVKYRQADLDAWIESRRVETSSL